MYATGSLVLRGMTFLLAPITVRLLSPADFGLLAMVNNVINVSVVLLGCGLPHLFTIEFFHHSSVGKKELLNDILLVYCMCALPCLAFALWYAPHINRWLFCGQASLPLLLISAFCCFTYVLTDLYYQTLRNQQRARRVAALQMSAAVLIVLLYLLFVWRWRWGVTGVIAAYAGGTALVLLSGMHAYWRTALHTFLVPRRAWQRMPRYLVRGLPFVFSLLANWILASSDRWVLARMQGLHDVGIYSIANTFAQVLYLLVVYPLNGAYVPRLLQQFVQSPNHIAELEGRNRRFMWACVLGLFVVVTIGLQIADPLLRFILPATYHTALPHIWLLCVGQVLLMGTYFTSALIQYHKHTVFLAIALILPALCNVGLNILLIPRSGVHGCVVATVSAYALYFVLTLGYNYWLMMRE